MSKNFMKQENNVFKYEAKSKMRSTANPQFDADLV